MRDSPTTPHRPGLDEWRYIIPFEQRMEEAVQLAARDHIGPAAEDGTRTALLLVDPQLSFCHPDFKLFVAGRSGRGALDDMARLCEFIYRNIPFITHIIITSDDHTPGQIFHPDFWVDEEGRHPLSFTPITSAEIAHGGWRVDEGLARALFSAAAEDYLTRYAFHYVKELERTGQGPLIIWPYHAIQGSFDSCLVPALEEALFVHSIARRTRFQLERKKSLPLAHHYSVFGPEVDHDHMGIPITEANAELTEQLFQFDHIFIAGEASSHCVAATVRDLAARFKERNPGALSKVFLLVDCMSPVVIRDGVDFTQAAEESLKSFAREGMHLVESAEIFLGSLRQ